MVEEGVIIFMALMSIAVFLGMFQKTRDGILCGVALVLLLITLSTMFPDSVLAAVL